MFYFLLQLLRSVMLVNFLVSATNSTTPIVFQAITDVIKNKIVMMALMKRVVVSITQFWITKQDGILVFLKGHVTTLESNLEK